MRKIEKDFRSFQFKLFSSRKERIDQLEQLVHDSDHSLSILKSFADFLFKAKVPELWYGAQCTLSTLRDLYAVKDELPELSLDCSVEAHSQPSKGATVYSYG